MVGLLGECLLELEDRAEESDESLLGLPEDSDESLPCLPLWSLLPVLGLSNDEVRIGVKNSGWRPGLCLSASGVRVDVEGAPLPFPGLLTSSPW